MLRTVWYKIEENRTARSEQIFGALVEKGIPCRKLEQGERTAKEAENLRHMILLTDDRTLVKEASQEKIACVGVAGTEESFFEGADLVVEEPEELELRELEDYLFHCHGIPVTIAQTGRLTLREMIVDDWQVLDRISRQHGMEKARRDAEEDGAFGKERLASYINSQYRLYGYGLWAVVLTGDNGRQSEKTANESEIFQKSREKEAAVLQRASRSVNEERTETIQQIIGERMDEQKENIIGCCGFSELNENLEPFVQAEQPTYGSSCERQVLYTDSDVQDFSEFSGPVLELQYMLDEVYRRRSYGTEMCRAAISYAYEYLEAKEIWVRVRSDYPEALSFARSLGFRPVERETKLSNHTVYAGRTLAESGNMCGKKGSEYTEYVCDEDFPREHTHGLVSSVPTHIVWLRHEKPYF